ncbi:response regulator, partial [Kitasatospora aureofaciens]|uniref:response regulator n=1 Tax=Kitasatospora aureofaciens TaxID=1894 RepID=UPI0030B8428E
LATADESLVKLTRLVDNLLDMSRLQAGALTLHLAPTSLEEMLVRAMDSLSDPQAPIQPLDLDTAPPVLADPPLLERVLANVITNALRHNAPGAPVLVEPALLRTLRINLQARHYSVLTAATGQEALDSAGQAPPDAILLDLGLPDLDGVNVIVGIRSTLSVPIIVLTGRDGIEDKLRAFDAGADDYVTKPFIVDELMARLRAVLRRPAAPAPQSAARIGPNAVDLDAGTVTGPDGPVRLTPTEWRILALLLANPGRLVPGRQILTEVWGPEAESRGNYLRVYFSGLRRKLEPDPARPRHLITEPGIGYRYEP